MEIHCARVPYEPGFTCSHATPAAQVAVKWPKQAMKAMKAAVQRTPRSAAT
jgi:hypothetical protein